MKCQTALAMSFISVALIANAADGQGQVYCGRRLAETLAFLCENPLINRPSENLLIKRADVYNGLIPEYPGWPWISQHRAKRMRSKRQVVSECCDKPCTMNELLAYCEN